jgi:hypothetical protein
MRAFAFIAIGALCGAAHAAPRAEIQVALCEPGDSLQGKLALRARGAPYETWLFDDRSLTLLGRGLRLRLRVNATGSELTLKAARQDCESLAADAVPMKEGKCEIDVHGDVADGAVSLSRTLDAATSRELIAGRIDVAALLSDAQSRFLRNIVKAWPLPSDLRPLGPISNRVYRASRYDVDVSTLPDGQQYAEIADKVRLERVPRERDKLMQHLARANVEVCAKQEGQAAEKLQRLLGK